ncbi:MAG: 1-deoxy-D-xylulose-5-phosphate synthase, partial [Clostridia bacterium]|nr:1-deoxy-D-xylulose-5-phosphate synthase [Clostridia bacterium]
MNSIDKIIDKNNIKTLTSSNSVGLCQYIRNFLVENVLETGGHLASNLGVVELTLAMHKVFDFPTDKIIFDVGHQSYVHKILSGRHNEFATLRKFGGISGFPKTSESEYDSFNTGHSSTSISAAVGIARARDLKNEDYNVIAFIGDGALGGGMAFEALNDVGANKTKVIIILNDNEMSINHNVGGLSAHLTMLRTNKKYLNVKSKMQVLLGKCGSFGKMITKGIKTVKRAITFATVAAPMFEELGIKYIGIIDGHNIDELTDAFEKAKNINGPVIIHTLTQKGRGYDPAEKNPDLYHGVSAKCKEKLPGTAYTQIFGDYLFSKAKQNHDIVSITAAMADGCGLNKFSKEFSDRFFDVGIAEQHAVTLAAGLASRGVIPVFSVYSTFLQRSYDQLLHDVCMQNLHVIFAIDRAGVVGEDGETHQGLFDLSYLLHMPQMTV